MMFLILCIFLLMAALVGVRAGRALGLRPLGVAVCGLASVAILPLFVLVHFAGGGWSPATARAAAFAADIWLAVLFWMSCILLALDLLWNLPVLMGGLLWRPYLKARLRSGPMMMLALGLTLAACVVGLDQAASVQAVTVRIETERLAFDAPPLRIVLLADLHLGRTAMDGTIRRIHKLALAAKPDLLLSSGDFVDAVGPQAEAQAAVFRDINPPLGKYAVLGNHECYSNKEKASALLSKTGFAVLRNQNTNLGGDWRLSGVDDPAAGGMGALDGEPEKWLLGERAADRFRILLKHQPEVTAAARRGADLQLSGHTHNGQLFPFGFVMQRFCGWPTGRLLEFREGLNFYIAPGAGTWGPPFRLAAPPEVTIIEIVPKLHPPEREWMWPPAISASPRKSVPAKRKGHK